MTHSLKSWPGEFEAVRTGVKTHEVRCNDRDFKLGDFLILEEWVPVGDDCTEGRFTGRSVLRTITYITPGGSWGLGEKICVLSIK
jgi:hypothetical protein